MGKYICLLFYNALFWMIITGLTCFLLNILINVLISYLWLFLIEQFIPSNYYFIKYFLILILFIYNWLVLRKIVISWLFEWQFPIQKFSIYKERQNYITYLKLRLRNFIRAIEAILDVNYKITKKDIEDIEYFLMLFDEEFNIYDKLYNSVNNNLNNNNLIRYKMSNNQIKYYDLLKAINRVFNENNTKYNLLNLQNIEHSENDIKINNFTVNQNFENKKNLTQLNMLLKEFENIIAKYDWDNYTYMSPYYLYNLLFNDTFGSLDLYHLQLKKKLEEYEVEENFTPKGKIHYTLVRNNQNKNINNNDKISENNLISENSKNNDGALMLFCLPNGGCYELIPKIKFDFYLNNGFSFLCWNYKGYGYSKGRANFSNCKSDALEIYDTVVKNPKYNFTKICVMGHSIGGLAACYLAKHRHVDLLISDRNFCDMTRLVNNLYCGQVLSTLIKYLFIGKTDNINNFLNFSNIENDNTINNGVMKINGDKNNINRIIIYSPIDMLILNDSTVKSGVSRYIIKKYIIYKNENNQIIKNKENLLDIVFNKNDKTRFITNFLRLMHYYYDKDNINLINDNKNDIALNVKNENDNNNNKINENINFYKDNQLTEDILFSFFDKFFGICCDNLNILSQNKISLRRETIFINNFFNNLLIWGAQGGESEFDDYFEFYPYKGKKILQEAYDILANFNSKEQINISPIARLMKDVSDDLKKVLNVINNLDIAYQEKNNIINKNNSIININNSENNLKEQLISNIEESEINTNSNMDTNKKNNILIDDSNNFYEKLNNIKGSIKLFKSMAGHNGLLRIDEREQFYTFLLTTGIIG